MALNTCELYWNGIKIASFCKNYKKCPAAGASYPDPHGLRWLGAPLPDPRLWYVWVTLLCSTSLPFTYLQFFSGVKLSPFGKILLRCQTHATVSDFPIYNIFVPQKVFFRKFLMTSCMWFGPLLIKNFSHTYGPACSYCRKRQQFFWPFLKEILFPPPENNALIASLTVMSFLHFGF